MSFPHVHWYAPLVVSNCRGFNLLSCYSMLLDTMDSFTIPDYLRDQLAEFEEECVGAVDASHIRRDGNNISDPTRENLYE